MSICVHTHAIAKEYVDDRRIQDKTDIGWQNRSDFVVPEKLSQVQEEKEVGRVQLTEDELKQHPDVLMRALGAALMLNQQDAVHYLLRQYRLLPISQQNATLLAWAEAIEARGQGDYADAIVRYQNLLASYPQHDIIRLQLATVLTENQHFKEADEQFAVLEANNQLLEVLQQPLNNYRVALRKHQQWQFYGGVNYVSDQNINHAPRQTDLGGNWVTDKAQTAHGVTWQAGASKKYIYQQGWLGDVRADATGTYYWDSKHYNDMRLRINVGGGRQHAYYNWRVLPFAEFSRYAGGRVGQNKMQRFSETYGLSVEQHYRFHPNWQWTSYVEYGRSLYRMRPHLSGHYHVISNTLSYFPNPHFYWQIGADYTYNRSQDADDSYIRQGVRTALGYEKEYGLSGRMTMGYATRRYRGEMPIFGKVQRNHEHNFSFSIWHNKLNILGVVPRLNWQFQQNNSNIALHRYRKSKVAIEWEKRF